MNLASESQLLRGLAELAVLGALARQRRYGLDLLTELTESAGLNIGEGTIYPLLHRLERGGLVEAEWSLQTPSGRPRKYYSLSDGGRDLLREKLASWRSISGALNLYLEGINP